MKSIKTTVKNLLPKNQFARGVSVLVGGTAGAQILMVLAAPLLTRLYSPEDFGLLAVFVGILALFTVVASLRYELAIPLPEDDRDAGNLVALCLCAVLGTTAFSILLVWVAGGAITEALDVPALASYFWLLPVGVLLAGVYQTFTYWSIRFKQFPTIARTRVWQALTTIGIQVFAYKAGGVGLVLGQASGQAAASVNLARTAAMRPELRQWSWRGVRSASSRYRRFPIYDVWYGLFFTAGAQLPILLFASLFNPAIAGYYALANRVLAMPMGLVGNAIAQVFLSGASQARRENRLGLLFENVVSKLIYVAMPPAIILLLTGPEMFRIVFGQDWAVAGEFARIMTVWIFTQFITAPLTTLFSVLEKQSHGAFFQALMLVIRVAALLVGYMLESALLGVALFSVGSAVGYTVIIYWMAINTGASIQRMVRAFLWASVVSLFTVIPLLAWKWFGLGASGLLLGGVLSGLFVVVQYFFLLKKLS